jgi:hypothetical protein
MNKAFALLFTFSEPNPTEEFGRDCQEAQWSRNMRHAREETHRTGESEAPEPTQHLLRTVREEDDTQHQSQNCSRGAIVRSVYSTNQLHLPELNEFSVVLNRSSISISR